MNKKKLATGRSSPLDALFWVPVSVYYAIADWLAALAKRRRC